MVTTEIPVTDLVIFQAAIIPEITGHMEITGITLPVIILATITAIIPTVMAITTATITILIVIMLTPSFISNA